MNSTLHRLFVPMVAAAVMLTVAACGGDDGTTPAPETTSAATEGTEPPAEPGDTSAPAETTPEAPPADDSCQVEVTGDKQASWTGRGGIMALNTEYWLTDEIKEQMGPMLGEGFYFILNCQGDEGSISFLASNNATAEDIPFGPATYELGAATDVFGGSDGGGPIRVMFTINDSETNWGLSEPGTLEITAFDDERIAGTFSFAATDVLSNLSGTSEGDVQVTGSFNFKNPN